MKTMKFIDFVNQKRTISELTWGEANQLCEDLILNYKAEICSQGSVHFEIFNEIMETLDS